MLFGGMDEIRERKLRPASLLKEAEKLGMPPQVCAYVGD